MADTELQISVQPTKDCRSAFAPIALKHQQVSTRGSWIMGGVFFFWLLFVFGDWASGIPYLEPIGLFGFIVGIAIAVAIGMSAPKPICPACKTNADDDGRYCPECGAEGIKAGGFFTSRACLTCKTSLNRGKGNIRRFKLRFCQKCGVHLHEAGI